MMISDLLLPGEESALTQRYLSDLTGMSGPQIRARVHAERCMGLPIISSGRGYYLGTTAHERRVFARSMRHRAEQILRAADGVETGRRV